MSGILDLLNSDLGKQIINGVSSDTNQSQDKTSAVMSMGLPLLMGAMKRNTNTPEGAAGLMGALNNKHNGSILDDLGGLFNGGVDQEIKNDGAGILNHVLGGSQSNVTNAISQKSGMDSGAVMNILKVAAPLLLGYFGKQQSQQSTQSNPGIESLLGDMIGSGSQQNKQQSIIESILDGDNDGSVIDDLAGMALGGENSKSDLGGLLGGLFGK